MVKQRLDTRLVDLGLCESRQQAQRLIRAGEVRVDQQLIDKPGSVVKSTSQIQVKQKSPYVSRGGKKLAKALAEFPISVTGRVCLDGGISTGGFTDCLLQAGGQAGLWGGCRIWASGLAAAARSSGGSAGAH